MRKLGTASRVFRDKLVIVETLPGTRPPRIGDALLLADHTPVGKVVDVIGPVDRPLVLLFPNPRFRPRDLLGKALYLAAPTRKGQGRRRRRGTPRGRLRGRHRRS